MKYQIGNRIRVVTGTFKDFTGTIREVRAEEGCYRITFDTNQAIRSVSVTNINDIRWYPTEITTI